MARSGFIWLVMRRYGPVAAFTVKHELIAWLEHHRDTLGGVTVYKMADNPTTHPELFTNPTPNLRVIPLSILGFKEVE